jgi:anti-sigma factor RsiW
MTCHETGRLIDPYVDDELGPDETARVVAHVEQCAACRRRLDEREALGRLIRMVPYHRASERSRQAVTSAGQRAGVPRRTFAWAAAAMVILSLGGVAGLRAWRMSQATSAIADALVARHVNALATQLFAVQSSDQHTVKPWFQGKLDFSPPVRDLNAAGFPLLGGRVDMVDGRPVAALVYQRRLHMISVTIWPADDRAALSDARTIRGFHERHWVQDGMSFWAVSDVNDDDLKEFVRLFRLAHT